MVLIMFVPLMIDQVFDLLVFRLIMCLLTFVLLNSDDLGFFDKPCVFINAKIFIRDCDFGLDPTANIYANLWKGMLEEHLRERSYMAKILPKKLAFMRVSLSIKVISSSTTRHICHIMTRSRYISKTCSHLCKTLILRKSISKSTRNNC